MSIMEGLAAAKAGVDLAKKLNDLLNHPNPDVNTVRAHMQEMLIHVVNAQIALGDAQVELSELRQKAEQRDALKALDSDMEFQTDGGFLPSEVGIRQRDDRILPALLEGQWAGCSDEAAA